MTKKLAIHLRMGKNCLFRPTFSENPNYSVITAKEDGAGKIVDTELRRKEKSHASQTIYCLVQK